MQFFQPDMFKCIRLVRDDQDDLLRLGGLISLTDRLQEAQDLVFTGSILTEALKIKVGKIITNTIRF